MPPLSFDAVSAYLSRLLGRPVQLLSIAEHGRHELGGDLKSFGYGTPVFLEFKVDGTARQAVLETMAPSSFGHEHFSDRAQNILWEHGAFNELPRHVRSLDSGAFLQNGALISTGKTEEFFLLTEFVKGEGYFRDLDRIRSTGQLSGQDVDRATSLASYLAQIHAHKHNGVSLYVRRIRDLLGHGECIMGLIDNYPPSFEFIDLPLLQKVETACLDWRWRVKHRTHRLCQVHGDFHPWNILFQSDGNFVLLDRSRGIWGEPADDITCLAINYVFSSLIRSGRLEGPFERLYFSFWDRYLEETNDREMFEVAPPFLAWRGLVLANPTWYPHLPEGVRQAIFNLILNVLSDNRFDHTQVNRYLK
jgi:hypothetical protein